MKFRNFDKIGLTTDEQIKEFLGEEYIQKLTKAENMQIGVGKVYNEVMVEAFRKIGIEDKFINKMFVSLMSRNIDIERPLLCLIHTSMRENEIKIIIETTDGYIKQSHCHNLKTIEEALQFADKLFGVDFIYEVDARIVKIESEAE